MTKTEAEQYTSLVQEIKETKRRYRVTDSVHGSSKEPPYTVHSVTVQGIPEDELQHLAKLEEKEKEIRLFIHGLPDSETRRIATMRIIQGLSWDTISAAMGYCIRVCQRKYLKIW